MSDEYHLDLKKISLKKYKAELAQSELLPSRKILQDELDKRFENLENHEIKNLDELLQTLKTPEKIKKFSDTTGLPLEYLQILKREVASYLPKPVKIADFPSVKKTVSVKLDELGINNTRQLFSLVKDEKSRKNLSQETGIPYNTILELTKLCDVCRIRWVGANFARLLVDSEYDTLEKITNADYQILYKKLVQINKEKKYFKGMFGANDMKLCILAAKSVPIIINYEEKNKSE